jgi:predicted CXXCH cytochrome family protein
MTLRVLANFLFIGLFGLLQFTAFAQAANEGPKPRYLTSVVCTACHEEESSAWRQSHHALAWQLPNDETVLGDFDAGPFEKDDEITHFTREGGSFLVGIAERDGAMTQFEVVGTAGVAPLQQYLVETGPGRLQALAVAWDNVARRWYHLYPDADLPPTNGLHWTGPYKNWNARCAECHATAFEKNYDPQSRTYASTQSEIGVGCEACHGPGEAHVAWANEPPAFELANWSRVDPLGLTHAFPPDNPEAEIQQCAGCHSRREPLGDASPQPGTAFHDAYKLALMRDGLYHADGQILDEVYVYGSFLQSRMYSRGVRCSNCHDPHSGRLRAEGNAVCTQCHAPAGNPDFPSLTLNDYDTPRHHFHEPGSSGAQCKSCHMIERVYMGIDGRRDHSFRIPRPDLSATLGTPNACTDCHDDRSTEWTAETVASWFPDSERRGEHIASAFAAAWKGEREPRTVSLLVEAAANKSLPAFVRASALETLRRYASADLAEQTKALLMEDHPLVRMAAVALQWSAPPELRAQRVLPLLEDPTKAVRIEAVRGLLDLIANDPGLQAVTSVQSAFLEYRESLIAKADFPETQMAMAGTALTFRQFGDAESSFVEAVRLDPQLVDAWVMIARLRAAQGDEDGAIEALESGLTFNPRSPTLVQLLKDVGDSKGAE